MKDVLLILGAFLILAGIIKLIIALIMRRRDNNE